MYDDPRARAGGYPMQGMNPDGGYAPQPMPNDRMARPMGYPMRPMMRGPMQGNALLQNGMGRAGPLPMRPQPKPMMTAQPAQSPIMPADAYYR